MIASLLLVLGLSTSAHASDGAQFKSGDDYSKAAVYLEGNTLVLANSVNLSGEYRALPWLAVSGGLGTGNVNMLLVKVTDVGGRVMAHAITGKKNGHFEAALGLGFYSYKLGAGVLLKDVDGAEEELEEKLGLGVTPETFVGYRYQPSDGGILFRVGLAWSHGYPGISSSLGYSF